MLTLKLIKDKLCPLSAGRKFGKLRGAWGTSICMARMGFPRGIPWKRGDLNQQDPIAHPEIGEPLAQDVMNILQDYLATGSTAAVAGQIDRLVEARLDAGYGAGSMIEELLLSWAALGPDRRPDMETRRAGLIGRVLTVFENRRDERLCKVIARDARYRLGQNLHDSLAQSVYGLGLLSDAVGLLLKQGNTEAAEERQKAVSGTAREILAELRVQIFELLPTVLDREGLDGAIRARLAAVEDRAGVRSSFEIEGDERPSSEVESELLSVAQELLNNSLKHARARHVSVVLRQTASSVQLDISDDGVGFVSSEGRAKGGLGLAGIDERVKRLGACLSLESTPGHGTWTRVTVPREADKPRLASSGGSAARGE